MWDIPNSGLFTKVHFNGYEDTTELNDNPVTGAEQWFTSSIFPKVLTVTYDSFRFHPLWCESLSLCWLVSLQPILTNHVCHKHGLHRARRTSWTSQVLFLEAGATSSVWQSMASGASSPMPEVERGEHRGDAKSCS